MSFFSKLERWLPFKFNRKKDEGGGQPVKVKREPPAALATRHQDPYLPAAWSTPAGQLMQRMFEDPFFRDPFAPFEQMDRWFGDFSPAKFRPIVDVVDEETALCVTAELPGMTKDDIQLRIDQDMLVVRGEKKNANERTENGVYRSERFYGAFERAIPLPSDLDHDAIDASFDNGVLTVRLPKVAPAENKARTIAING